MDRDWVIMEDPMRFDIEITLPVVHWHHPDARETVTSFCESTGHRRVGGDYMKS